MENMVPNRGRGRELQEMLRKELGIPDSVRWFTVKFAIDSIVTVTCEYLAREPDAAPLDESKVWDATTMCSTAKEWERR